MPILTDIPVALSPEEIIPSNGRTPIRPALLRDAEEAIKLGETLWQPRAVYDWFEVQAVEGERVKSSLSSDPGHEAELQIGPKADLLEGAERVLVSVGTIGPELEVHVAELHESRETLKAYMLDSAGVVALGAIGEAVRCLVEEAAADRDWGVSPGLSPGSLVGWPLRGQRDLCALLPLDSIGVRLNKYTVLEPHKSTSGLVGLGPGYDTHHVGSVCKYCDLSQTCWRRREDPS